MDKPKAIEYQRQIRDAIGAHGAWKARLVDAIAKGTCPLTVAQAQADDACAFGKWLKGGPQLKVDGGAHFEKVSKLHRDFHVCAGRILALALSGHGAEAAKLTMPGTDYAQLTGSLGLALMNWDRELAGT